METRPHKGVFWLIDGAIWAVPFDDKKYECGISKSGDSSQSELRLPLLQVVSSNKYFSVGVQSPTEINAPRGCAVILKRRCQLALTRITHQVSRAFDLKKYNA